MPLSISILGGTGVYARHLIPRLVARGHHVRALARRPEAATVAAQCGAEVRMADTYNADSLRAGVAGTDVAVNLVTALGASGGYGENDRVRREGVPIFLEACAEAGVPRVLQQSIGMICGSGTDAWTDEDDVNTEADGAAGAAFAATLEMEAAVRASSLDWLLLRGALFYGPGTGFDDGWFERARAGRLRLPGDGSAFMSLVHIADMANATAIALEKWPSREAVIVADDSPPRWSELFNYIAAITGAAPPEPGGQLGFPSIRLRNTKAKEMLGWTPLYPDYRSGLAR